MIFQVTENQPHNFNNPSGPEAVVFGVNFSAQSRLTGFDSDTSNNTLLHMVSRLISNPITENRIQL